MGRIPDGIKETAPGPTVGGCQHRESWDAKADLQGLNAPCVPISCHLHASYRDIYPVLEYVLRRHAEAKELMRIWKLTGRVLIPMLLVRLYYLVKHRAFISSRAEVDLVSSTDWGTGCIISAFAKVKIRGPFVMGRRVHIASGSFIGVGPSGMTVGDDAMISPNCTILTGSYRFDRLGVPLQEQGTVGKPVRIGHRVWIGSNAVLLAGSDVGDDAIVSAGSVVTGIVPPNTIVLGNPAKVIFTRR